MAVTIFDDDFTGTAGSALNGRTANLAGGTWGPFGAGFDAAQAILIADGTVSRNLASGSFSYLINSSASTAAGETMTTIVQTDGANGGSVGQILRADGAGGGYMALWTGTTCTVYRMVGPTTLTSLGSASGLTISGAADTLTFDVSGTGATISLTPRVNGALTSLGTISDTNAARITSPGKGGIAIYGTTNSTTFKGFRASRVTMTNVDPPAGNTITISSPIADAIQQRDFPNGSTGTLRASGTFTGTPTSIEARVVDATTLLPISGHDWTVRVPSPSGASWSVAIPGVPAALQWLKIQVRFSNDTAATATSNATAMGDLVAFIGQSNVLRPFDQFPLTLTPSTFSRYTGNALGTITTWANVASNGAAQFANDWVARFSVPVGLISAGVGGTSLASWQPVTGANYVAAATMINAAGGKLAGAVWCQGEFDAANHISQASYASGLTGTIDTGLRTLVGNTALPVAIVDLGQDPSGSGATNADYEAVRAAQAAFCAASPAKNLWIERADLDTGGTIHLTTASAQVMCSRAVRALGYGLGQVATYRGPRVTAATVIDATHVDVTFALDAGTDWTGGTTGWRVTNDGSVVTVTGIARQSATKVRLTTATSITGVVVVGHLYGITPDASGVLRDNSTLALPLEWNGGVTASSPDLTAPTITGPGSATGATSSVTIAENTTAVHTFAANEAVTWSISGGADAAKFTIGSSTGVLAFASAPNFEAPTDANGDNAYIVAVQATDLAGNATTQTVTVSVVNANEAPSFAGPNIATISGTAGAAIGAQNFALLFTDPDASDPGTYTKGGTWPVGPTLSSAGALGGVFPAAGTYTGLTVVRTDASGLTASSNAFQIVASAPGDTTAPTMTGTLTVSPSTTTASVLCPTAADNVAVTAYECSINGGSTWPFTSATPTVSLTGLTSSTTYTVQARAKDAAGNVSTPVLSATFTTSAIPVTTVAAAVSEPISDSVSAVAVIAVPMVIAAAGAVVEVIGDRVAAVVRMPLAGATGTSLAAASPGYTVSATVRTIRVVAGTNPAFSPKDPAEVKVIGFDFGDQTMNPTAPIVTAAWHGGAVDLAPAAILDGEPYVQGTWVLQRVIGGVDRAYYALRAACDDPAGNHHVMAGVLPVRNA